MPTLYTKISPHAAVAEGLVHVYGVVVPILILSFIAPIVLVIFIGPASPRFVLTGAAVLFIVLWCLAWLAWSLRTPHWRLWAYRRVDDLALLKREAVAAGLLWPEGHLFQRTEIVPPAIKAELDRLEREHADRQSGVA